MRMWGVNPKCMCDKHLLGEHVEMHMFVGCINKRKNIDGYLEKGLVNLGLIRKRHDELVQEMERRGMNHKSPLPNFLIESGVGFIDKKKNLADLIGRCFRCMKKYRDAADEEFKVKEKEHSENLSVAVL